jgi:hypothetical protein
MSPDEMQRLFERHRDAEAARDYDAILAAFVPDLAPDDEGHAFGDDVMVAWGTLRGTSAGDWVGVSPSGRSFAVPFANASPSGIG